MERWNGIVEWWNGGILEWWIELLTTLYRFYSYKWTNWACALAIIDIEKTWMYGLDMYTTLPVTGELSTSLQVCEKEPVYVLVTHSYSYLTDKLFSVEYHINPWHTPSL